MQTILEAAAPQPGNLVIGVTVFVILLLIMAGLHGFGAGRPHS